MSDIFPDRTLTNFTILIPNGTTQHGNEHILCLPITVHYWPSVSALILFFVANYLAHAATVKSSPGDASLVQACNAFLALMFPMSGLLRALNAIARRTGATLNEIDKACRAGALCMVVREPHWRPQESQELQVGILDHYERTDVQTEEAIQADLVTYLPAYARENSSRWVHFDSVWARSRVDLRLTRVHGSFDLPEGYAFAIVPRNTVLLPQTAWSTQVDKRLTSDVSASFSALKALASILQVIAAFTTLLSHRPDLIKRWGYASYHLTVIPYLFMTFVNLISNMMTADYPCLYMVRTETMNEAQRVGGRFEGEVAQTITIIPKENVQFEDPTWNGLTGQNIKTFSKLLNATASGLSVVRLLDYLPYIRRTKKQSARDARVVHVRVINSLGDFTIEELGNDEDPMSQQRGGFDETQASQSTAQLHTTPDDRDVEKQVDTSALPSSEPGSTDKTYRVSIPQAPHSSLGEGFLHTMRSVLEDMAPARSPITDTFLAMVDSIRENKKRLKNRSSSASSRLERFFIICVLTLQGRLLPMDSSDRIDVPKTHRATIYHPNCERFLRSHDLKISRSTKRAEAVPRNTQNDSLPPSQAIAGLFPESSTTVPIAEHTEALAIIHGAENIEIINSSSHSTSTSCEGALDNKLTSGTLTSKHPALPVSARTMAIAKAASSPGPHMLLYLPNKQNTKVHTRWAVLIEACIGTCIVGFFFGFVAGLTGFRPGDSSSIERGIMMTWLASGLYGFCLPLMSTLELFKLLFLLPFAGIAATLAKPGGRGFFSLFVVQTNRAWVLCFVPLGMFIPPIWGFVLVGRMLTEWGDCVRLY